MNGLLYWFYRTPSCILQFTVVLILRDAKIPIFEPPQFRITLCVTLESDDPISTTVCEKVNLYQSAIMRSISDK